MLETRNLCKIYKPKRGVPVTALNNVSLKFPEKGMIFLLGKSGSGKSTLLNLLGGLDKYDSGEIIIKGVSSKDFKQQYFDSYRNTYVGFIFQEYNILEEFSVGANIALAIELQGRKATDEEINNILKEVDLEGYGNRKPNELSGGQKQRVAIARALVKNPEIIMADEPTGALDSNTGKQVFDTLKRLSKDKLVIIVSHDREFSEQYADRIIELSDGCVISDVELVSGSETENVVEEVADSLTYSGNTVEIPQGYHLTEYDRIAINEYIDKVNSGSISLIINSKHKSNRKFAETDQSRITQQDGSTFKLIKSKLPFKSAFKIGASGLKYKKVKLVFTIILSCVAFMLFGLADTFGSYNHIRTCTNSLMDSDVNYASLVKSIKYTYGIEEYWDSWDTTISKAELETIIEETGIDFTGVCVPRWTSLSFRDNINDEAEYTKSDLNIYSNMFYGFAEISEESLEAMSFELVAGKIPDGNKNEIAISKYIYETFVIGGYRKASDEQGKFMEVNGYDDIIGKTLNMGDVEYIITGIVDTDVDLDRYKVLTEETVGLTASEEIAHMVLYNEMECIMRYSMAGVAMVGEGFVDKIIAEQPPIYPYGVDYAWFDGDTLSVEFDNIAEFEEALESGIEITWIDGERTSLADDEIIVSIDSLYKWVEDGDMMYSENIDESDYYKLGDSNLQLYAYSNDGEIYEDGYKIVGVIDSSNEKNENWYYTVVTGSELYETLMAGIETGEYNHIIGAMPENKSDISELVKYSYKKDSDIRYEMQNPVTYELDAINSVLKVFSKVFLFIGIGFAVFAALMLANFIGTSISYKKQEIGILRAIGSRSNDVFGIFFSESLIIAIVNFVISTIGVAIITLVINGFIRYGAGLLITVLHFGIRQILLLLVVSVGIAALASFIPVKKIASKRPIDAIRNR